MPPGQLDHKSDTSKRHQRSRSLDMTRPAEVIDLTTSDKTGTSSSLKHDRNNQDTQAQGPSKRLKHSRDSEPPMPSRTSSHQKLKESVATLERDLANARQAHHATERELERLQRELLDSREAHQDTRQQLRDTRQELKNTKKELKESTNTLNCELIGARLAYNNIKQELGSAKQKLDDIKQELEDTKQELKDSVQDLEFQLKSTREAHNSTKHELKDTKEDLASKTAERENVQKICDAKSEEIRKQKLTMETGRQQIQSLKALLDDPTNGLLALQQSCRSKDENLKAKDAAIAAQHEELDNSKHQIASLQETLEEANTALKNARSKHSECRDQLVKREEKLSSTERALDEAMVARGEAEREADALLLVNAKHGHQTHSAVLREEKAKSELKSERKDHKNKISELQEEKTELQIRCAELQATIQRHNYKEPDEKIKKDFASLESRIRQFVDKFARPVLNATDKELQNVWPNWSPKLREFLASPLLCNLVLEAYVWEYLVARIFAPGSQIWAGKLGQSLEKTLYIAADEIAGSGFKSDLYIDLQYLRSSSSSLVSRVNGADFRPKYFDSDVKIMMSNLAKLVGPREVSGAMQADAMKIFSEAREFEVQLRMLKAIHDLRMYKSAPNGERLKYGFNAADEDMEDRSPDRRGKSPGQAPPVDFIMCPGLYKRGSNSGTNYETTSCLIKMGVVCNATELCLKPGSATPARSTSTQTQNSLRSGKARQENGRNNPGLTVDSHKAMNDHARAMRAARGRGSGSAAKKTKTVKHSDPDSDYIPENGD